MIRLLPLLLLLGCDRPTEVLAPPAALVPHTGTYVIELVATQHTGTRCKNPKALACTTGNYIILGDPNAYSDEELGAIFRHELAHTQGWKH